ncbi:MAG: winged helix-turn-helix transcriptional regulator, partial [Candidatus Dormibacteraceae bacterium]
TLGFTRFERLRDELRISDNMLADRLNRLVEARLLVRVPYRDRRRTRHEYRLTEAGAATEPILLALAAWGQEWTGALRRSGRMEVVHTTCGARVGPGPVCPSCGEVLRREDQEWVVPWLSEDPMPLAAAAG